MAIKKLLVVFVVFLVFGCTYSQKEYDLQKKYNKHQQQVREAEKQDSLTVRW